MKKILSLFLLTMLLTGCNWNKETTEETVEDKVYPITQTDFENVQNLMKEMIKDRILQHVMAEEPFEKSEGVTALAFAVDHENVNVDFDLNAQTKADLSDAQNTKIEADISLEGKVNVKADEFNPEDMNVEVKADLDYKQIGKALYAYLSKLDITSNSPDFNPQMIDGILNGWKEKWLKLDLGEIAQALEGSELINMDSAFKPYWNRDYVADQINLFLEPNLFQLVEEKGEQEGFLVYEVSLDKEGVKELVRVAMEQTTLPPAMITEGQKEIDLTLNDISLSGEMFVLKADAKYFKLDLRGEMEGEAATADIQWLQDKKIIHVKAENSDDPEEDILFEWNRTGEDAGTFSLGTADKSLMIIEGEHDPGKIYATYLLEPANGEWNIEETRIIVDLNRDNNIYSGRIEMMADDLPDGMMIELETVHFSREETKIRGTVNLGNQKVASFEMENENKEVAKVDIQAPAEVESLTQMVSGFLSLITTIGTSYEIESPYPSIEEEASQPISP